MFYGTNNPPDTGIDQSPENNTEQNITFLKTEIGKMCLVF